jgi:hypothetical protein
LRTPWLAKPAGKIAKSQISNIWIGNIFMAKMNLLFGNYRQIVLFGELYFGQNNLLCVIWELLHFFSLLTQKIHSSELTLNNLSLSVFVVDHNRRLWHPSSIKNEEHSIKHTS